MAVVKCHNCNQFYDNEMYATCPYCNMSLQSEFYNTDNDIAKTEAYYENVHSDDKTIGIYFQENDCNPVTGWLVCIEGTVRGKSYEIHMNRNFIGRDKLMDVAIPDDLLISRNNHLSLTYDQKSNRFFIKNESGSVTVNGNLIEKATEIFENDEIAFGESKYIFVPYCNNTRSWNDDK